MYWGYCKAGFGSSAAFVSYNVFVSVQVVDSEGWAGGRSGY